jgi:5'-methylthioadenosine phosphorylase
MKVAFVSGTSIRRSQLFADWATERVDTPFGSVAVRRHGGFVLLDRHGENYAPPHVLNHRANIRALHDLGYREIVSLNSVGSLRPDLPPGSLVSCSDYVCLQQGPATFHDDTLQGTSPGIDNRLIPQIVAGLAPEFGVVVGQVYVQMRGPRFETRAEIRVLRHWGDVIGMTAAHEADLCRELDVGYNSLAFVDNYANGLMEEEISFEKFRALVKANQARVDRLFARLLEILR